MDPVLNPCSPGAGRPRRRWPVVSASWSPGASPWRVTRSTAARSRWCCTGCAAWAGAAHGLRRDGRARGLDRRPGRGGAVGQHPRGDRRGAAPPAGPARPPRCRRTPGHGAAHRAGLRGLLRLHRLVELRPGPGRPLGRAVGDRRAGDRPDGPGARRARGAVRPGPRRRSARVAVPAGPGRPAQPAAGADRGQVLRRAPLRARGRRAPRRRAGPPGAAGPGASRRCVVGGRRPVPDHRRDEGSPLLPPADGHTWQAAAASPITLADARVGAVADLAALDASSRSRWERATRSEQRHLRAMAQDGDAGSLSSALASRLGKRPGSLGPARAALIAGWSTPASTARWRSPSPAWPASCCASRRGESRAWAREATSPARAERSHSAQRWTRSMHSHLASARF